MMMMMMMIYRMKLFLMMMGRRMMGYKDQTEKNHQNHERLRDTEREKYPDKSRLKGRYYSLLYMITTELVLVVLVG
mgnify:CR=1 FL=1